jgi:hypothetical protein
MLSPRIIAACSKVLIDANGNATLIELLDTLSFSVLKNVTLPPNAAAPKEWSFFTMWQAAIEDLDKSHIQIVKVLLPDNTEFTTGKIPIKLESKDKLVHQTTVNIVGFPIGKEGTVTINTWLELDREKISETYSYKINVKHVTAPPETSQS